MQTMPRSNAHKAEHPAQADALNPAAPTGSGAANVAATDADPATAREWLSALVDGECPPERLAQALAAPGRQRPVLGADRGSAPDSALDAALDTDLCADWSLHHWIGESLRGEPAHPPASPDFANAVLARLAAEPAPAWSPVAAAPQLPAAHVQPESRVQPAANDAVFRWKMLAGLASVASVAALSWSLLPGAATPDAGQQWAQSPPPLVAAAPDAAAQPADLQAVASAHGLVWRDPQFEALMAAHRQHGSLNALHVPVGFMRNATYDRPAH
jgi:sigma-E factor negative regulatory protein RseA